MKQTLKAPGINTSLLTAHSTRHSSSSKIFMKGLSLTDIVKKRGWKSTSTFRKFYNLPILNNWIIVAFFTNILFRLYVTKKYDNQVYISSTFIMLSNLNYYTWIICRTESGNNFKIKRTQWRLIGIVPRFCEAN